MRASKKCKIETSDGRIGYGIVGQVISVPIGVNNMVTTPQRQLDDDYSFNVHLKRNLIHKSTYLQGCTKKATVK
jgi:hypothetical protein